MTSAATSHIRHGYNGVLAMPGDEEAFCDAANWLLEDREHLRRARLNARHHASHQGWPAIIEQFENQLRDVCAEPLAAPTQPYVRLNDLRITSVSSLPSSLPPE